MTIIEAIDKIDNLKPNVYEQPVKIAWLSALDGMIYNDIIKTHFGDEEISFDGYTDETPLTKELLVKEPYDDVYLFWMESKIDYFNNEYSRYNNSATRFNDEYQQFTNWYNRNHKPKGVPVQFF